LIDAHYICWYVNEDVNAYFQEELYFYNQIQPPVGSLPLTWIIDVNTTNALDATSGIQFPNFLVNRFTAQANQVSMHYTSWAALQGIPTQQRGISNCPAGDGIPNLLKYACGLTATNHCSGADLMQPIATDGTMEVIYFKSTNAVLSVVDPVWSSSLLGNAMTNNTQTNIYLGTVNGRQKWKAVLPASTSQGFMRLKARQE
jgi:hypothetical protein